MFELRWLESKTGKRLQNEWGFYYDETETVLQYRHKVPVTDYQSYDGDRYRVTYEWSEWRDVPTIENFSKIKLTKEN